MRRVVTFLVVLCFAVPCGISLAGCGSRTATGTYCSGSSGPIVGQAQNIRLLPDVGGITLNFAQSQTLTAPTATDCKGSSVSISSYQYAVDPSSPKNVLDINPTTGNLCAGVWNRNTAGGVPDYSTCLPTGNSGVVQVQASGGGASSNKVLVYIHPVITDIEIGAASTDCVNDPATNCSQYVSALGNFTPVTAYTPDDCLSFGQSAQLVARFYKGPRSTTLPDSNNITYVAGFPTYTALTSSIGTFDTNNRGIFTATAPGATVVTATLGPSAGSTTSNAGFVAVCPPKSITINTPNAVNGNVSVNVNNTEPLTATVLDTKNVTITGLNLTYISTSPVSTPVSGTGITPTFAGGAAINAFCLPPTCNPAPLAQIGRYPDGTPSGNGKPVASNTIVANAPGTSSSLVWVASTDSLYLLPLDLTTNAVPSPTKLPYQPNSMVLTQDGASIFLGSNNAFMTYSTGANSVTRTDLTIQGTVLAASPDSANVVATDPARKLVYIYQPASSTVVSSFGGVGTRAAWTPDATTAYILTSDNRLLVYNNSTSWHSYDLSANGTLNDVVSAIPAVGGFIGTTTSVNGRSYCPNTTTATTDYYPQASNTTVSAAVADRLAATNDGKHLLDVRLAAANGTPVVNDLLLGGGTGLPVQQCPLNGSTPAFTTTVNTAALTGLLAGTVTGVYPASDSSIAFITNTPATGAPSTGALLSAYRPTSTGVGTTSTVTLATGATAAVAGALSSDNRFFFAGTSGDNKLHFITVSTLTDTRQITPNLPSASTGGSGVPNLIVARPRTALAGQ